MMLSKIKKKRSQNLIYTEKDFIRNLIIERMKKDKK